MVYIKSMQWCYKNKKIAYIVKEFVTITVLFTINVEKNYSTTKHRDNILQNKYLKSTTRMFVFKLVVL